MGKGDKKTRKGKRFRKSFGNSRPRKRKKREGSKEEPRKSTGD
jgi:ribosomal small subunit protein bTHX